MLHKSSTIVPDFGKIFYTLHMPNTVSKGTIHPLPPDVRKALLSSPKSLKTWNDTTPLARNEWICWITSGKKAETRGIHIKKGLSKLASGMRRPCCWAGCPHR